MRRRGGRPVFFGLLAWLLAAGLLWPSMASAVGIPSTYPGCATRNVSVAWGGSVSVDLSTCHSFGLGVVSTPPAHGTTSEIGSPVNGYSYAHNALTPAGGGVDQFVVLDDNSDFITVNVTIQAPTSAIVVTPAALPAMTAGAPISQTLSSTGGVAPYSYALDSGTLPPGLTLSSGGVLSGTPTQRGGYSFTVRSTDNTSAHADKGYTGTVQSPSLSLGANSGTAIQGVAFSQTLTTNGGVAPYSYQLETGSLPAGIVLSSAGVVSGTTSVAPGNYPVTIRVTDASTGPGTYFEVESYTLTVSAAPSVSIAVSPASVSEDGATNLVYTVTRSLNLSSPTVVNITTSGTATAGTDYTGGVSTVSIPAGATTATITIDPTVDAIVEANETVILTVAAGTGYTVGAPSSATGTILNDDVPSVSIAVSPGAVAEDGSTNLIYTVTLNQASLSAISVNFTTSGSATSGTDYAAVASPLVIAAGTTTGTITIDPTADATIEANETVVVTLNAGAGYTVGVPNSATGTITNDDTPSLSINDVSASEGNAGTINLTFTVSLGSPAGPGGVTFDIATANNTATAGSDYVAQSLTGQTIPAGVSTYTFSVLVNGDTFNEPNETFFVNVTNVTGAMVVDGQGIGTITNDDAFPSLSINDATVVEGNSGATNATFTVTLSAASGQIVAVNYATADGTATSLGDYTAATGTLTFAPGQTTQTISISVLGENVPEANETFFVNLSGAANATISDNQGVGTITNDDVPVTVSPSTLPNGIVATAYSQTISAGGGTAPYAFALTAGALPAGLSLSPTGTLAGTPTAGGTFNFTVTATDSSPLPGPFNGSRAYSLTIAAPTVILAATPLAGGTLGTAYSASITPASGGSSPYTYAVTAGSVPGGLSLNASTGAITGTPSALGTFNFSITATDSSTGTGPYSATQAYAITVTDVASVANPVSVTVAYGSSGNPVTLHITGGAAISVAIGTAATHGTATAAGTSITYTPTAGYAGGDSFTYTATNSGGTSAPATVTVTVSNPTITITASGGLAATTAVAYSQTFTFNGGAQPWGGYQVTNLPAGLAITATTANTVTISGAPTQAGTFNLNVSATDSSTGNGPYTVGQGFVLTVAGPTLSLSPAGTSFNPPYATPYTQTFTATGGIGPYTYAATGSLPPGLSFTGDTLSGTPTAPGSYSFTITATDTGSTGTGAPFTVTEAYTVNVSAPVIVVMPATLPATVAAAAYSQTITASGGVGPYAFSMTSGSLPAGITLASGGVLSGTSSEVGSFNFTVTATDANGQAGSRAYTLAVTAPTLTMTPASGTLIAPYGTPYAQAFTTSGGSGSFSYALTGSLPAGLSFSGNTLAGTPTAPGSYPVTVTATDTGLTGAGAPFSVTHNYTIDVPAPTIVVNPATLPAPVAAAAYSQTLTASGGTGPYAFAVTAGALPGGFALAADGTLSGTSTTVGTFNFTVTATDANGQAGNRAYTLAIAAPALTMTPASGTLHAPYGTPYTQAFTASGGSGSFSYTLTGSLPAGLSFSGNTLAGTPTAPGSYPVTVTATDTGLTGAGAPFSVTQNYTIDVPAPTITIDPAMLPDTTAGLAYSQALAANGGAGPYTFTVTAGTLPDGLALSAAGLLAGTTTTSGSFSFTVTATDTYGQTAFRAYTVVVEVPTISLNPATLPAGTAGTAYTQMLTITGGIAPYTLTQGGTLPAGLSFDAGTRTFSGTPTQSGTFHISVTATDSTGGTAAAVTNSYTLTIAAPTLTPTPATVPAGTAGVAYAQSFIADGGIAPYTYTVSAGALPAGVTLQPATGALSGTPTVAGSFGFSVTATDSTTGAAGSITQTYTLEVSAPTITLTPETLASGTYMVAYAQQLTATGGTAPYRFTVTAGTLPSGMSLDQNGRLSGAPDATASFTFTVTATDALGFTGTRAYTLVVAQRPDPSQDPEVRGLINAQAEAARRFATSQIGNFQQRLQRLHGHANASGFSNSLSMATRQGCMPGIDSASGNDRCDPQRRQPYDANDAAPAAGSAGSAAPSNVSTAFGVWAAGMLRSGNVDSRGTTSELTFETDGVSAGADYRISERMVLGMGVGYGRDRTHVGENGSRSDARAYTLAGYASISPGERFFVDAVFGYQTLDFELRRHVAANGSMAAGSRNGSQWFGSVSAGADLAYRSNLQVTPYLRLDVAQGELDGYAEQADAPNALTYGKMDVESTTGNAGVRFDWRRQTAWGSISPQLKAEYQHDFSGSGTAMLQYSDLLQRPFYRTALDGYERDRWILGAGLQFNWDGGWGLRVDYRAQMGGQSSDHGVEFHLDAKF